MTPRSADRPLQAIVLILLAAALFAVLDATGKHLSQRYPVPFLVWARFVGHLTIMVAFLAPSMRGRLFGTGRLTQQLVRGLALVGSALAYLGALARLPLAECTALMFLSPLAVTLLAGPALREKVGPARLLGAVCGFIGVLFIVRPGAPLPWIGVLLAFGAVACLSLYYLITRMLSSTENSLATLFYTALVGAVVTTAIGFALGFPARIAMDDLFPVLSLGATSGVGHFLVIRAFHHAPASMLMPFAFSQLIWAALLGWVAFGQLPDPVGAIGMLIIVSGGIWVAAHERSKM